MNELHVFASKRISEEYARQNDAIEEVLKAVRGSSKLEMFKAKFVSGNLNALNELKNSINIK